MSFDCPFFQPQKDCEAMDLHPFDMEELHLSYKTDVFGNDILTRINWSKESGNAKRPIGNHSKPVRHIELHR